jgi:hypothetical protein
MELSKDVVVVQVETTRKGVRDEVLLSLDVLWVNIEVFINAL